MIRKVPTWLVIEALKTQHERQKRLDEQNKVIIAGQMTEEDANKMFKFKIKGMPETEEPTKIKGL